MPGNIKLAVETANDDEDVHVIILSGLWIIKDYPLLSLLGNGKAFCSGYDLQYSAQPGEE
jgi:enoyl-CoA hydratase/carnithine racemase